MTTKVQSGNITTVLLPVIFEPAPHAANLKNLKEKYHAALVVAKINQKGCGTLHATSYYYDSYDQEPTFRKTFMRVKTQLKRILGVDTGKIVQMKVFQNT